MVILASPLALRWSAVWLQALGLLEPSRVTSLVPESRSLGLLVAGVWAGLQVRELEGILFTMPAAARRLSPFLLLVIGASASILPMELALPADVAVTSAVPTVYSFAAAIALAQLLALRVPRGAVIAAIAASWLVGSVAPAGSGEVVALGLGLAAGATFYLGPR